jgi:hypothetical protein
VTRAKGLADDVARAFGGRVRREDAGGGPGWPETQFVLKTTHQDAPIEIRVFDSGCTFQGRGWGRDGPVFVLGRSLPSIDKRVTGIPALEVPLFRHGLTSADDLRELFGDGRVRRLCTDLKIGRDELLVVTTLSVAMVHRSTDVEWLRRRLDLITELVPQPKPARGLTRIAHRIRIATGIPAAGGSRHRFGGALEQPAMCRNCHAPAHLLLTFDPTDAALGLEALGPAPIRVVFCIDCMTFPSLTYVDQSGPSPTIVSQMTDVRHDETPALEPREMTLSTLKSASAAGSKLGGSPKWIQAAETPDCIRCKQSMAFLAQLASTRELSFADDGVLYTFVCEACRITASLVQSH